MCTYINFLPEGVCWLGMRLSFSGLKTLLYASLTSTYSLQIKFDFRLSQSKWFNPNRTFLFCRGGVAGPVGPAKAGPLFRRSLVSFPDCRDSLPTGWLGQVSHASSPLPSV